MISPSGAPDRRADQLRKLTEIGRALTYTRSMEEVLPLAVNGSADLLEAARGVLMLADDSGLLRVRAAKGIDEAALEEDTIEEVLIARLDRLLGAHPAECFMGVPLVVRGVVIGLLAVVRPEGSPFDEEDEWILSAAADPVAASLENARLTEELRRQREEGSPSRSKESTEDSSDRALATLSHDLRSPLNAIDSYAELIEMELLGSISERQREALGRIRMSGRHLLAVLENVLDMTRLSAGTVRFNPTSVAVATVVEEAVLMVRPSAECRSQSLIAGETREMILEADPDRLRQVLVNLLGNAIKYTGPGGTIRISSSITHADGRDWGSIEVADTGPGIPPEKLGVIFQPYYRLPGSENDSPEGVGLGLAISRELIRRMGGDIDVESELGEGCVFRIRLPMSGTTDPPAPEAESGKR